MDAVDLELTEVSGDDRLDLVAVTRDRRVLLALGTEDGGFGSPTPVSIETKASRIVPARLNRDRFGDVLVVDESGSGLRMRLGDGQGLVPAGESLAMSDEPNQLHPLDIDGDRVDELVVSRVEGRVYQLGPGQQWIQHQAWSKLDVPRARLDMNHDRVLDLVSLSPARVWFGTGAGRYLPGVEQAGVNGDFLSVLDLDRDGEYDLVGVGSRAVTMMAGIGDGSFWEPKTTALVGEPHDPRFALVTPDEALDLVDIAPDASGVVVYRGCRRMAH